MLRVASTSTCLRCLASPIPSTSTRQFSALPIKHLPSHNTSKGKQVARSTWVGKNQVSTGMEERGARCLSSSALANAGKQEGAAERPAPKDTTTTTRSRRKASIPFFTSSSSSSTAVPPETDPLPSTSPLIPVRTPLPTALPPTLLSNGFPNPAIRWRARGTNATTTISEDLEHYKALGKFRLSCFVVLTAMASYTVCPVDPTAAIIGGESMEILANSLLPDGTTLSSLAPTSPSSTSATPTNDLTLTTLVPLTVGTALSAFSSAAFNEVLEAPYDAQMARTRNRPVPKRVLSPLHATTFGALTGAVGLGTLYAINPLCSFIALSTIVLYCPIYTIMKRHTIYNTWFGAIVGGLPPLIGWAACTGSLDPFAGGAGGWAMFLLLYFWQFPHFNALSHNIKSSYAASGYRMLSVLDPKKNALVAFRYAVAMIPLSFVFPVLGLTNAWFPWVALIPNGALAFAAFRFWRERSSKSASWCFGLSLVQLPAFLALAIGMKKGLWDGWFLGTSEPEVETANGEVANVGR